jgi:hypothetical protein
MTVTTRRDFFKSASLTAAAAALPATALTAAPRADASVYEPEWLKRLRQAVQGGSWEDIAFELVFALHGTLAGAAPEGMDLAGFQYRGNGHGGIESDTIWATVRGDTQLAHWRPAVRDGWFRGLAGVPAKGEAA